jgi:hypothetical protein
VFKTHDAGFHDRLRAGIARVIPAARVVRLAAPPVLGSALIGLDRLAPGGAASAAVAARARADLEAWSATARVVTAS